MTPFSCVLIGDESLLMACGDTLAGASHDIRGVISEDAQIIAWAEQKGFSVLSRPSDLTEGGFDWLFSIGNLRVIPQRVLDLATRGAINFHDGPLPAYAGLNTPAWAIVNGEKEHGVSWHFIEGGIDEGDLIAQAMVQITPEDTAFSLNSKCYAAAIESFAEVLREVESGTPKRHPQDLTRRSYFGRDDRPAPFGRLRFDKPAAEVLALVRGLDFADYWNPLGHAKVDFGTGPLRVTGAALAEGMGAPGQVLDCVENRITIACTDKAIHLTLAKSAAGISVGDTIPAPEPDLMALAEATAKGDGHWRAQWRRAQPAALPFSRRDAGETRETRQVARPDGLDPTALTAVLMKWALQACGTEAVTVALATPSPDPTYIAPWVPLSLEEGLDWPATCARVGDQLQKLGTYPHAAADLAARDTRIDPTLPDVALVAGDAPAPDAAMILRPVPEGRIELAFDPARVPAAYVDVLVARLALLLDDPDATSLPEAETALVQAHWSQAQKPYDTQQTLHAAFEAQVLRTPDADAVVFEGERLSYAELNARANQVAHALRAAGAGKDVPIGLYATRSAELLIGALGILKAGGAYVPLDPAYPADRITHYIADSGTPVILAQEALHSQLPTSDAKVIGFADAAVTSAPQTNPGADVSPGDMAYLIYTSGSTGTPKGVMVEHGNVVNFFSGMDDVIRHDPPGVWLAVTSLSFDISVLELFWTLARGFKLVLSGDDARALVSSGAVAVSDRKMDFNLFYWGNDDGVGPKKYELLLEGAKFADAHGFNAVWTPERHFHAFGGPYPNPSVTGAAVAAVTQNLDVRAGSCVAPLHHPARIAEEWAVIDNMTNGRVGLAIASGWQPDDFVLRPENTPPANKPAMFESIEILRKLWAGDPVAFPTKDGTPFEVVTQPRPVSAKLPVWVTTAGNPETWKEAGAIGANVLTHLLGQSVDEVAEKIKLYHGALREAGHDPAAHKVTLMLHTYLSDSREQAEKIAREPMKDYLRSAAGLIKQYAWAFPAFKKPQGVTNPFQMDLGSLSDDEMEAILDFAFERYFNDSGLFGTVADGVARAEQLKAIGVDEIACLIDYGIAPDVVLEGLKPLAEVLRLSNEGPVVAEDDFSIAAQIRRHGVSHLQCTPSMAQMLVTNDDSRMALGRLSDLMIGGEGFPAQLVSDLQAATSARLTNMYGPTETTIWSATHPVTQADGMAPLGQAIANTRLYVLRDGKPCGVGMPGELFIGGDGVTRGYWNREALTQERFPSDPFAGGDARMYATGDLVQWLPDGTLGFLGRTDHQVKIRGHRIELGEIEARLARLPGVTQAVVIPKGSGAETRLVGYVTADAPVGETSMREALGQDLPEIMVPAQIVVIERMPLTPNKKIDRKALPEPAAAIVAPRAAVTEAEAPKGAVQQAIAQVWSSILGVSEIRAEDNFFALGGHSLLAVQAHRDIRVALGNQALSITDIFRFPTLEGLAAHLGETVTEDAAVEEFSGEERRSVMSRRKAMRGGRRAQDGAG